MRFFNDGEEFGVATSQTDVELARAGRDIVEGLLPFADALGLTEKGRTGECDKCNEEKSLRRCAAHKNGQPVVVRLCQDCQDSMVEEMMQTGQQAAVQTDVEEPAQPETVPDPAEQIEEES